jgi:hypothetical protein
MGKVIHNKHEIGELKEVLEYLGIPYENNEQTEQAATPVPHLEGELCLK